MSVDEQRVRSPGEDRHLYAKGRMHTRSLAKLRLSINGHAGIVCAVRTLVGTLVQNEQAFDGRVAKAPRVVQGCVPPACGHVDARSRRKQKSDASKGKGEGKG